MQVRVSNNLTITNPSPEIITYCKDNLTLPNPDYAKKIRMGFWVGNTPKELHLYESRGNELVIPYGCLKAIAPLIKDAVVESDFKPSVSVEYGSPIPLYPYQQQAVESVYEGLYGILQSPCGSGKTRCGLALIKKYGKRALWLTHTGDLLRQSKSAAEEFYDKDLLGTITEGNVNIGEGITFATVQTMCKLDLSQYKHYWDVIVVDECFPENTMIQTPHGQVPIQYIVPGEFVVTRNDLTGKLELCRVEELQIRELKGELVKVTLTNGREIICTINHPFYTQNGYKKAGDLTSDDEVRMLWKGFRYFDMEQNPTIRAKERGTIPLLLQRMLDKNKGIEICVDGRTERNISTVDAKTEFRYGIRENEKEQPYVKPHDKREDVEHPERDRTQAKNSRWERSRSNRATKSVGATSNLTQSKNGVRDTHKNEGARLSHLLQNRHRPAEREDSNRSRWWLTLLSKSADRGYEKSGVLTRVGVESVEVLQQGSDGTFDGVCGNGKVYNLSVSCNHNYFANGVLVHNCHRVCGSPTQSSMFSKVLNSLSARHKYGLSATVHRADGMIKATFALIGDVIYTVPDEAIADKVMQVGIQPVATGLGISRACLNTDGTLNYAKLINYLCESNERNALISRYIVAEACMSCLILSDRLEHLETLMNLLPSHLRDKAVMISGKMTTKKGKEERAKALTDMRSGEKKYLFATYSLCKEGLDIPRLERLFLTTSQSDYAVITQSIGRIARTFEGKADPIVYDFVDNIGYLQKRYKKRCATYKKNDCYFIGE